MKQLPYFQYFGLFLILLFQACGNAPNPTEKEIKTPIATAAQQESPVEVAIEVDPNAPPFIIHYTSPKHKIIISESTLTHHQKEEHFGQGSTSATTTTNTVAHKEPLSQAQINVVQQALSNGFMQLNSAYGGPSDEEHYPYFINVSFNGENKEVLFRSNSSYESAPEEFKKVETAMFQISKAARQE